MNKLLTVVGVLALTAALPAYVTAQIGPVLYDGNNNRIGAFLSQYQAPHEDSVGKLTHQYRRVLVILLDTGHVIELEAWTGNLWDKRSLFLTSNHYAEPDCSGPPLAVSSAAGALVPSQQILSWVFLDNTTGTPRLMADTGEIFLSHDNVYFSDDGGLTCDHHEASEGPNPWYFRAVVVKDNWIPLTPPFSIKFGYFGPTVFKHSFEESVGSG